MMSGNQKLQNLEIMEILQKHILLDNDKHQSPTATCMHSSQGSAGGGIFTLVCKKVIYQEPAS